MSVKINTPIIVLCILLLSVGCRRDKVVACSPTDIAFGSDEKIKGVNFDASVFQTTDTIFDPVLDVNAEWTTIIPFGYINPGPPYNFNIGIQFGYWGLTDPGLESMALFAKTKGIKVMIKPQVSINAGQIFTGDYKPGSEAEWQTLETDYRTFILHYLQMALTTNADAFCIGTEWKTFVVKRPEFWNDLIQEVRSLYGGKLTYAANWDEYEDVPFWSKLDFIGVDAYFPLSDSETPTVQEIETGWREHIDELKIFACLENKQIAFTEYGYRSMDNCAKEPWNTEELFGPNQSNLEGQRNAYEGFFKAVWKEEWFAGGFLWKWFGYHDVAGGPNDNRFTPQNKPAEEVIREYYGSL